MGYAEENESGATTEEEKTGAEADALKAEAETSEIPAAEPAQGEEKTAEEISDETREAEDGQQAPEA